MTFQTSSCRWRRTPPVAKSDASVSIRKGSSSFGIANTGALVSSFLISSSLAHMDRSSKRPKISDSQIQDGTATSAVPKCYMSLLPLELVAEILSYTASPRDILALARTSKHFCSVLVNNPAAAFIWREARARAFPLPIPDFTPNFTEASYAALLFDSKTCEVWRLFKTFGMCLLNCCTGLQVQGERHVSFFLSACCGMREGPSAYSLPLYPLLTYEQKDCWNTF